MVDSDFSQSLIITEAGRRVQLNIGRKTLSSIIQTFRRENRYVIQQRALCCDAVYLLEYYYSIPLNVYVYIDVDIVKKRTSGDEGCPRGKDLS